MIVDDGASSLKGRDGGTGHPRNKADVNDNGGEWIIPKYGILRPGVVY